jgi:hypothetical protein
MRTAGWKWLAKSDVVRTGTGRFPGAKTWQEYGYGFGPHLNGTHLTHLGFQSTVADVAVRVNYSYRTLCCATSRTS